MSGWSAARWLEQFEAAGGALIARPDGGIGVFISMYDTTEDQQREAMQMEAELRRHPRHRKAVRRMVENQAGLASSPMQPRPI